MAAAPLLPTKPRWMRCSRARRPIKIFSREEKRGRFIKISVTNNTALSHTSVYPYLSIARLTLFIPTFIYACLKPALFLLLPFLPLVAFVRTSSDYERLNETLFPRRASSPRARHTLNAPPLTTSKRGYIVARVFLGQRLAEATTARFPFSLFFPNHPLFPSFKLEHIHEHVDGENETVIERRFNFENVRIPVERRLEFLPSSSSRFWLGRAGRNGRRKKSRVNRDR